MSTIKSITVSQAVQTLAASGIFSKSVAQLLTANERVVQVANVTRGFHDPVMSCFLMDASGSMDGCQDDIIEAHNTMLETLRSSSKCTQKALYVAQYLFSTDLCPLNAFIQLDAGKNDSLVILNSDNYALGGGTALYTAIYRVLQDMTANIAYVHSQQIKITFNLVLFTSGEDTEGGMDSENIKAIIQELKSKGFLSKSMIVGFTDANFTAGIVHEIKEQLGFDIAVISPKTNGDIRQTLRSAFASHATCKTVIN